MVGQQRRLTPEERQKWDNEGFLLLRDLVPMAYLESAVDVIDRQWRERTGNDHAVDLLTGPDAGRAFTLAEIDPDARNQAYKLNNLFGRIGEVRRLALLPQLQGVLTDLLDGEPVICNSLHFERGSQQELHIDSWYMPGPNNGPMLAASFALDDVDTDNGPILYYPGSHRIPPYLFSNGLLNEIPAERPDCMAYLDREIAQRGLSQTELHARRGDVFIWHGQMIHGGKWIQDFSRTRRSLVVHYWRGSDLPPESVRRDENGAYLGHTLRGEISF
jgi:hypothetical protein